MKNYKSLQNGSDIRGVAMELAGGKPVNLTEDAVTDLSKAFVKWLSLKLNKSSSDIRIAVGRDSRLSGEALLSCCSSGILSTGANVLNCGMATTPAMFMATVFDETRADGSIMITASHLPPERNGLKFFTAGGGLDKEDIQKIIEYAEDEKISEARDNGHKKSSNADLMKIYSRHLRNIICRELGLPESGMPLKDLHIIVDAGNGAGGFYASDVLEPLGADCSGSQFLDPDGSFPNHQPNPENEEAMQSICAAVKRTGADLGIIFDTDGDRSSAVDENGNEIARNRIVALAALIASEGHPGTTIVTDSITSTQLSDFLTQCGLKHFRYKRGYRNVINKGMELNASGTDCQLAIETSGHAAMKENYFLDDGAYLSTRIVIKAAMLKKEGKSISSLLSDLKDPLESKEIRFNVNCDDFGDYAQRVLDNLENNVRNSKLAGMSLQLPNYEGVRVNVDSEHGDGWFLLRKSLHDPVMPLNIESNVKGGVERIFYALKPFIEEYDSLRL